MEPQTPAEGILKTGEYGDAKFYHVHCACGSEDCAHEVHIEVEADDCDVQVHIYATVHTKWWEKRRWHHVWQILTRGYADMQTTIVLNEQAALNYSAVLKSAMEDVRAFKEARRKK